MKILAIDCGNTRMKYARFDEGAAGKVTALAYDELAALDGLLEAERAQSGQPDRVVIANVAGDTIRGTLAKSLHIFSVEPHWIRAQKRQCGVVNHYDDPGQLGGDRWAALIGARTRERRACLVVNAGTATTIDALSAAGDFQGGLILPGLDLMRRALATGTAELPLVKGRDTEFPHNTADAIWNGCVAAQVGAIERMRRRLPEPAPCLLSGGTAQLLFPALNMPCAVVDNLVLEGLAEIAMESGPIDKAEQTNKANR
jgi:type III pantothenate kinase